MKYKFIYNQHIYIVHHLAFIFALEPVASAFWDILLMYTCDFVQIRAYWYCILFGTTIAPGNAYDDFYVQ